MSRIGKKPIAIPAGVDVKLNGCEITVKGPKGELKYTFNSDIGVEVAGNEIIDPVTGKLTPAAAAAGLLWTDNWLGGIGTGSRQEYNASVSGGNDWTKAYMSGGYLSEDGIVPGSGFDRLSLRTKVDQKISKSINAGMSLSYARTNREWFGDEENNYSNIFMSSMFISSLALREML